MTQSQVTPDVARLVRDAQSGDTRARDELVAAHLPLLYNIVGRALDGHPDVDDLVQETMLRVIAGLPTLREPERFRSWLVTIAYRQIQMHVRACRLAERRRLPESVEVPVGDFADRTAAELVVADQRRELLAAAKWLDDDDRRLLGLWWQETAGELTRAELVAALGVRPKHAAVRVQRMRLQLDAARGVVRALRARPRCAELDALAGRWDGVARPLWRKRFVRHVRDCPQCTERRRGLVAPEQLLLGIAALTVPAALLTGVAASAPVKAAAVSLPALLQQKVLVGATAATMMAAGGGLVYAIHVTPAPDSAGVAAAPPPVARPATPGAVPRNRSAAPPATPSAAPTTLPAAGWGVQRADIFVAPDGSDSGDGTLARPYATLGKAVAAVRPGQTIALRGGTYRPRAGTTIGVSGTADRRIVLSSYRDERPVIDAAGVPADQWTITHRGAYWTVQGLEIKNARSEGYVCQSCRHTVLRRLSLHDNGRAGLLLRGAGTVGNQVLDSDFFDNRDPLGTGGVGIGIGVQFGAGEGNVLRGNRAYGNAAAGFDLGGFGSAVAVEYNWSYRNRVDGFALSGGGTPPVAAPVLRHNAAWDNGRHGFTDDGHAATPQLTNNTAFRNRGTGFALSASAATLRSNAAVGNQTEVAARPQPAQNRNSWQRGSWSAASFDSTDPRVAEGARPANGRLPGTRFLRTGNGVGASMTGR